MNKKLVGALGAVVVLFAAVYLLFVRHRDGDAAPAKSASQTRAAKVDVKPAAAKQDDTPAPRGIAPKWSLDVDPEGPLRMEGQVVGSDGAGIGGAEVQPDAKGEVRVEPLRPGWIDVEVSAAGFATNSAFTTIGSGGATGQVTVTLHKGVAVSGRVIDEHGKPIAKAHVSAADGAGWG